MFFSEIDGRHNYSLFYDLLFYDLLVLTDLDFIENGNVRLQCNTWSHHCNIGECYKLKIKWQDLKDIKQTIGYTKRRKRAELLCKSW